ncbi:MAG TPA: signal peptidase II [Levilinea sp.]|nr:signal peptidase II [Levilinea sp.]
MSNILRRYGMLALVGGVIIVLDQVSKSWIRANLSLGEVWAPIEALDPFFRIVHWYNTGVAFGLFQNMNSVFSVLALIVMGLIAFYLPRVPSQDWMLRLALCLQFGGAGGNAIDRITIGHVTDFVSVGNFPVFNVADSSITIGVFVLLIGVWLQERRDRNEVQRARERDNASENQVEPDRDGEALRCE